MLILITYDVAIDNAGAKRLRKVAKVCMNYGQRVQNSVFECLLTQAQFVSVKHQLQAIIDEQKDSIRFYNMGTNWERDVTQMGKNDTYNPTGELII